MKSISVERKLPYLMLHRLSAWMFSTFAALSAGCNTAGMMISSTSDLTRALTLAPMINAIAIPAMLYSLINFINPSIILM